MKTTIYLDPEYIPWDKPDERIRLRKRNPIPVKWRPLAHIALMLMVLLFGFGVWSLYRAVSAGSPPAQAGAPPAGAKVGGGAVEGLPPPPTFTGKPGYVALQRGMSVTFIPCTEFSVWADDTLRGAGDTANAPVIVAEGALLLECDGVRIELP